MMVLQLQNLHASIFYNISDYMVCEATPIGIALIKYLLQNIQNCSFQDLSISANMLAYKFL
jgi:hypothetical protein